MGFFTTVDVDSAAPRLDSGKRLVLSQVRATISALKDGAGFALFIEHGAITMLEGYVYGPEKWPASTDGYALHVV